MDGSFDFAFEAFGVVAARGLEVVTSLDMHDSNSGGRPGGEVDRLRGPSRARRSDVAYSTHRDRWSPTPRTRVFAGCETRGGVRRSSCESAGSGRADRRIDGGSPRSGDGRGGHDAHEGRAEPLLAAGATKRARRRPPTVPMRSSRSWLPGRSGGGPSRRRRHAFGRLRRPWSSTAPRAIRPGGTHRRRGRDAGARSSTHRCPAETSGRRGHLSVMVGGP